MIPGRVKKEDLQSSEEMRRDECTVEECIEVIEVQCQEQTNKIKTTKKLKNFMKPKKNSNSKAVPSHENTEGDTIVCIADFPEDESEKHKMKIKFQEKMKIPDFMKRQKSSKSNEPTSAVEMDFNQNLEQSRLVEAQQQLMEAEERLFSSDEVKRTEAEEDKLHKEYEIFISRLMLAIHDSISEDNQETLKSALTCILQEEKQDRRWKEVTVDQRPAWRPIKCRQKHDSLLQTIVEERLKNADEQENKADTLSTSLKREVCRMGKQVQKDLLRVVRILRECYPADFDICRTYAQLYHQIFSKRLQELTRSSNDFEESVYILSWIKDYYPKDVLKHKELEEHINSSSLGPLLPEEDLKRLEGQYFLHKENEVKTWLSNALDKEVNKWNVGFEPELMDDYYFSNLAVDVLPLVDVTVKEANTTLGCELKTNSLLDSFLLRYNTCLKELVKRKQENIPKILSANLVNIEHFRDYIQRVEHPFSEDNRSTHLSTLADLKNICHGYFLSRFHKEIKPVYRKLWTQVWFAGHCEVVEELEKELQNHIDDFKKLKPVCREKLLAELHVEVMVEYVRRMMKRKLKLENKEQQEAAAELICQDSNIICSVFSKVGSKEEWLCQILPKLSEIIKLQDLGCLELEIVTLARDYPDIRDQHVLALLNLKTNLSSSDLRKIKLCLCENRSGQETESSNSFFSKVVVKKKII